MMIRSTICSAFLGALFVAGLAIAPAHAQATRTWISGVGDDANPCSRTAPCKTFAGAISKTSTGGEIDALDPGGFGQLTITKAITLDGGGGQVASILVTAGNGINVVAGASDTVILRNLRFNGLNTGASGVQITTALRVTIEKCFLQGFSAGSVAGIFVSPSTGTTVNVSVDDTSAMNNNAGMIVKPASGATANVAIERSRFNNNLGGGVRVDGTGGGTSNVGITDSTISLNNGNGMIGISGPGNVNVDMERDVLVDNAQSGVVANNNAGGAATVTVGSSTLSNNIVGAWSIVNTATLLSFKNNQVTGPTGNTPGQANFQ